MDEDDGKIGMLLDPENFYGEHESSMAPMLIFFAAVGLPALLYIYIFGLMFLPWWLLLIVYIPYTIKMALVTMGREKERVAVYKKQLNDEYASLYDLIRVKTLHPDGCCEYGGNKVTYYVVTTNKTSYDNIQWSQECMRFLSILNSQFDVDIYVHNIIEVKALNDRYQNVKLIGDAEAARDFLDIIDHNRQKVYSNSLLTRTIFAVRGYRSSWEDIKKVCNQAVHSNSARAFKTVYLTDEDGVSELLSRDVNGLIDLPEIMQAKYCTKQYYGSKVIGYDGTELANTITDKNEKGGFFSQYTEGGK